MSGRIDEILEECLAQLESGQTTLQECLDRYPDLAESLSPLLRTALQVRLLTRPAATSEAFEEGKELMLAALARRKKELADSRAAESRWPSFLSAPWTRRMAVGVLAVATLLVWVTAAGFVLRAWYLGPVPQQAVVADATGVVQVQTAQGAAWQPLTPGWVLGVGQSVRTGDPAEVKVNFFDGSTTVLGVNTEVTIGQMSARRGGQDRVIAFHQLSGRTHNYVEANHDSGSTFQVQTGSALAVVQGTEFSVYVAEDNSTRIVVIEGEVSVFAHEATVVLNAGEATSVQPGVGPGPVVMAAPEEISATATPVQTESSEYVDTPQKTSETALPTGEIQPQETPVPLASVTTTQVAVPAETPATIASPSSVPMVTPTPTVPRQPTNTPTRRPEPTPTSTPRPDPTPTPTATPAEMVEIVQAQYKENQEKLQVKARTSAAGCSLTLAGFGPMTREGEHWVLTVEDMDPEDVPATVTVVSSCGGSATAPVEW